MTTNTEALRAQFEREIGEAAPFPVERDGDSYINRMCAWAWEGYQAGHAAAAAETAAAVANERERCAVICDELESNYWREYKARPERANQYTEGMSDGAGECASAIRVGDAKEPS